MTTQAVADRYNELAQTGKWHDVHDELYSQDIVSIEPDHAKGLKTVSGMAAIKQKGKEFNEMIAEMHGGYCKEPTVAGTHFSVAMGVDATLKDGSRMNMEEICVFEVANGKIVKEQFFF